MTGWLRTRAGGAAVALIGLVAVMWAATWLATSTTRSQIQVSTSFEGLLPGETRTSATPVTLPVDVRVTDVQLDVRGPAGAATWAAQLCPSGAGECADLVGGTGARPVVAGGPAVIVVTVTAVSPEQGQTSELVGYATVTGVGTLPNSRSVVPSILATAGALFSAGALIAVPRRRRRDEPAEQEAEL